MSIQREYSLPHCKLILEGLTDDKATLNGHDGRPLMSILVNAQCYLASREQPISGGLEFFQSLVSAVNRYAQEFLSGVRRHSGFTPESPDSNNGKPPAVELHTLNPNLHRLIVQPQESYSTGPIQIDLNTVQLFDLVEAVDQFFADTRTLPQMGLQLRPLTKKEAKNQEPLAKKAMPAAVGVSSLALAAIALFFVPIPEVQRPTEPVSESNSTQSGQVGTSTTSAPGTPPTPNNFSPTSAQEVQQLLDSIPRITDPTQLAELEREVYNQIDGSWPPDLTFNEDLVYQLSVGSDGAILGYKPENQAAKDYQGEIPLLDLVYIPVEGETATPEKIGVFEVVFQSNGRLAVSPWQRNSSPSTSSATPSSSFATPSSSSATPDIEDPALVEQLQRRLYDTIDQAWTENPDFARDLIYRVGITKDGAIADYEAKNELAKDYLSQTPLEELHQPSAAYGSTSEGIQEPLAHYRVVFTSKGILEVSPWKGFN